MSNLLTALKALFGAALAVAVITGCGGVSDAPAPAHAAGPAAADTPVANAEKASITVTVQAPDGSAIPDVSVQALGSATGQTNAQGVATLDVATAQDVTLALTKAGLANQVRVLRVAAGSTSAALRVTMLVREAAQTLADIGAGGTVQGKDGTLATFPAGSLVDANGNVVSGAVQLQLTPVNVLANAAAFPGLFAGTQGGNAPVAIVSYGTAEFHPTQNGQKLQVAPGKTVTIEIPMYATQNPDGSKVLLGQVIPLWSLNESTGVWKQEGSGTVVTNASSPTGLALRAEVSHFSWWNCDDITGPQAFINVKCMLLDTAGNAVVPLAAGQTCSIRAEVSDPARRPAQRAEEIAGLAGLSRQRIPAGIPVEVYGEHIADGVRLAGMTAVNVPAGSTSDVVIALSPPVATTLTQPARNATLAATAQASAQVGAGVDKVELYLGGIKVAEDDTAPYDFSFSTALVPEGFSTLQARAIRGSRAVGNSDSRPVIIDRTAPLITLTRLNAEAGKGLVMLLAQVQELSSIAKVEFFLGTTKIGEDSSFPFEFTYTLQASDETVVSFTARAADPVGNAGVSNAIAFGTQAPTVSLARSPLTSPIISSQAILLTAVAATPASGNGIARVEFFKGSIKIGEDGSAPYELSHTLTGADTPVVRFMAKAVDNAGNVATAQQNVTVSIVSTDTVLPTVALDAVASPITSGAVLLAATAADNIGVAKVEFYLNGALMGERTALETGKYRFQVDASLLNGPTTFAAIAYDAAGNTAQSSQTATVSIVASLLAVVGADLPHNSPGVECAPSMGTAADGTIYVAHMVGANSFFDARVSRRIAGVWQSLGVANDVSNSHLWNRCPTMAVTAAGQPYVAYEARTGRTVSAGDFKLFVRRLTAAGTWETVREIAPIQLGQFDKININIDNLSRPLISWSRSAPGGLNVERFDGNAWLTLAANVGLSTGFFIESWRTAVRPDDSLAILIDTSSIDNRFIHAVNVSDAGFSSIGDVISVVNQGATTRPTDIAVTANETVISYSTLTELRTLAFSSANNAWTSLDAAVPRQLNAALAFQGGTLVQVLSRPADAARRWNGSSWSALTPLSPVTSRIANLHVFGGNLFMPYSQDDVNGGLARLNVP